MLAGAGSFLNSDHTVCQVHGAFFTVVKGVHIRSTKADSTSPKTECFQHIGPSSHSSIDENLHSVKDFRTVSPQLQEDENRGWGAIEGSSPMVADDDPIAAHLHRRHSVGCRLNALQDQGNLDEIFDPLQVGPIHRRVDKGAKLSCQSRAFDLAGNAAHGSLVELLQLFALVIFPLRNDRNVYRQEDGLDLLVAVDYAQEVFCLFALVGDIELEEKWMILGSRVQYLQQWNGRICRDLLSSVSTSLEVTPLNTSLSE